MIIFILGLLIFFAVHGLSVVPVQKAMVQDRIGGQRNYRIAHGALSVVAIGLIIYGWQMADYIQIYRPLTWVKHLVLLLMAPVFMLLIAQFLPGRIKMTLKYPALIAVKIWALSHLLANGHLTAVLFFGLILVWAGMARMAKKRAGDVGAPVGAFGLLPEPKLKNDIIAVVGGLVLYVLMLKLHPILIGVAVLPGA